MVTSPAGTFGSVNWPVALELTAVRAPWTPIRAPSTGPPLIESVTLPEIVRPWADAAPVPNPSSSAARIHPLNRILPPPRKSNGMSNRYVPTARFVSE